MSYEMLFCVRTYVKDQIQWLLSVIIVPPIYLWRCWVASIFLI